MVRLIIGIAFILAGLSAFSGVPVIGLLVNLIIAVILITVGVRIISRGARRGDWRWDHRRTVADDDYLNEVAIFSPIDRSLTSQSFKGGKVVMVFSGGEIDLSGVHAAGATVELEVSSVFSGLVIVVPKEWAVRSEASPVLGSVDLYAAGGGEGGVTLTLRGEAVFGEIKVRK